MFTLQILDRGQTLLYSPPDQTVFLGAADDCDFRLGEDGVDAQHARLEPSPGGLRLVALGEVLVNGVVTDSVELQLGDRIELGKAVLVVGQSVARPAQPEDVLDSPRLRSDRRPPPTHSRLPYLLVAMAVLITGALAVFNSDDSAQVDADIATIADSRNLGDLDRARAHARACRLDWIGAEDDRLQRLEREERKTEEVTQYLVQLEEQVLEPKSGTYASWIIRLRGLESDGEPHQRIAARITRSSLTETLQRRKAAPYVPAPEAPKSTLPQNEVAQTEPASTNETTPSSIIEDADRLAGQGLFAQAIALVQAELGGVGDAAGVAQLQRRIEGLRGEARLAMQALVTKAESHTTAGRPRDAVTLLALAQHRFPGSGDFSKLSETLHAAEAAAEAELRSSLAQSAKLSPKTDLRPIPTGPASVKPAAANPKSTDPGPRVALSALRTQLDRIRDAELAGAFRTAAAMLRQAVGMAQQRDADFAARLEQRAIVAEYRAIFHDAVVAALQTGRKLTVALLAGGDVILESVRGSLFVTEQGKQVAWKDIAAMGLAALADQVGVRGGAAIGAADLIYRAGDDSLAEEILARVMRADATFKVAVDRTIAIGRGERPNGRGYVLKREGFVSVRAVELKKETAKVASKIDGVFRKKDKSKRAQFVTGLLSRGPDSLEAVVFAFEQDLDEQVDKLDQSSLKKQVDRLAEQRILLDKARAHAKALIYDEVEYFYPYKPPAVTSDRFAQYNRVQADVYRRIDALRRIWRDKRLQVKVSAAVRTSLERLDWDSKVLQELGAFDAADLGRIEWIRALPNGQSIGITDFCGSVKERIELDSWRRIEAYNKVVGRKMSSSVRELLRITNGYRAMYRHRPLAAVPLICNAAQGHAEEMSTLGYFSHMSPTPGRRTPFHRMRLAGYNYGVSENIALNGSALGSHNAWLGSSGHHRNLLYPRHTEMGIGVDGRNWVENFGGGSTYEEQPAWLQAKPR